MKALFTTEILDKIMPKIKEKAEGTYNHMSEKVIEDINFLSYLPEQEQERTIRSQTEDKIWSTEYFLGGYFDIEDDIYELIDNDFDLQIEFDDLAAKELERFL